MRIPQTDRVGKWIWSERNIYLLYLVVFSLATLQKLFFTDKPFNNFEIFRYSFYNLLHNNDLYAAYPQYYFDLFKYNPSFALLMAPFWVIPKTLGVMIWNLGNAMLPQYAVNQLHISIRAKVFFALFILIEMLTSVQNAQSNGIMLGLMLLMFVHLENKNPMSSALMMVLGFFVKIFAVLTILLLIFNTVRKKFILWAMLFILVIGFLPALIIGFMPLLLQYQQWFHLLINDAPHQLNYSIMSFGARSLSLTLPNVYYLAGGIMLLLIPLHRFNYYVNYAWRLKYLSAILVWVVIFNHKAESPTFVIAMAGAALWFIVAKKTTYRWSLLVFVFVFTGLAATDVFPPTLRENFIRPYAIKVLPCIILFLTMIFDLLFGKFSYKSDVIEIQHLTNNDPLPAEAK
jgi:hypothetical protein